MPKLVALNKYHRKPVVDKKVAITGRLSPLLASPSGGGKGKLITGVLV